MTKFITLKQITNEPAPVEMDRDDIEDGGEDDGLAPASASMPTSAPEIEWKPNTINVDAIRNWYPRKGGRVGCRVIMKTSVAYIVANEHDEIMALING